MYIDLLGGGAFDAFRRRTTLGGRHLADPRISVRLYERWQTFRLFRGSAVRPRSPSTRRSRRDFGRSFRIPRRRHCLSRGGWKTGGEDFLFSYPVVEQQFSCLRFLERWSGGFAFLAPPSTFTVNKELALFGRILTNLWFGCNLLLLARTQPQHLMFLYQILECCYACCKSFNDFLQLKFFHLEKGGKSEGFGT